MLKRIFVSFSLIMTVIITNTAVAGCTFFIDNHYREHYTRRNPNHNTVPLIFTWADQEDIATPENLVGTKIAPEEQFVIKGKSEKGFYVTLSPITNPTIFVELMIVDRADGYDFAVGMSNGDICVKKGAKNIEVEITKCDQSSILLKAGMLPPT